MATQITKPQKRLDYNLRVGHRQVLSNQILAMDITGCFMVYGLVFVWAGLLIVWTNQSDAGMF